LREPANVPKGVGLTALAVALARAAETRRPDALFNDPLAEQFIATVGDRLPWAAERKQPSPEASRRWASFAGYIAVRTRFFDDYFREAATNGCRQMVVLGAGLDARAFRLDWPDATRLFEVDTHDMIAFKEQVIARSGAQPQCERISVAADLREDWATAMRRAGFHRDEQTAWLAEGLLIYLTQDAADGLMQRLSALSADGSRLALEHVSESRLNAMRARRHSADTDFSSLWLSGLAEDPLVWLARYRWQATVYDAAERAAAYGRPVQDALDATSRWLICASRTRA